MPRSPKISIDVEGLNDVSQSEELDTNKIKKESSGRIARPSTSEIRHEVMHIVKLSKNVSLEDFDLGVMTALEWVLGERKTLKRPIK